MIRMRHVFRSRWVALAWSASICWTVASFAHHESHQFVNAANSADSNAAQLSALAAEEPD